MDAELAPQEQEGQGGGRGEEAHEEGHEGAEGHRRHVAGGHQEEEVAEGAPGVMVLDFETLFRHLGGSSNNL